MFEISCYQSERHLHEYTWRSRQEAAVEGIEGVEVEEAFGELQEEVDVEEEVSENAFMEKTCRNVLKFVS